MIKIISILTLVIVFVCGVLTMQTSNALSKTKEYKDLDKANKQLLIGKVKSHWRVNIILMSILVVMLLIILGTLMGKTNNYENVISVGTSCVGILLLGGIIINKKNFEKEVKGFFSKE